MVTHKQKKKMIDDSVAQHREFTATLHLIILCIDYIANFILSEQG